MTDCALATTALPARPERIPQDRPERRVPRARPSGVPGWVRLLGVALIPLDGEEGMARTWVLSAGAATSHVAALLVDEPTDH